MLGSASCIRRSSHLRSLGFNRERRGFVGPICSFGSCRGTSDEQRIGATSGHTAQGSFVSIRCSSDVFAYIDAPLTMFHVKQPPLTVFHLKQL